jgi:hypothetical protein
MRLNAFYTRAFSLGVPDCTICINLEVTYFAYLPQSRLADGHSCISQFPEPDGHHAKWHDTYSSSKICLTTENKVLNQGKKKDHPLTTSLSDIYYR